MKSEQYWVRRMEQLNEAMLRRGEEYIRRQREEYERALAKIREKTERWYARLAKNNDISLAAARELLDKNELKEFHWTVEEYIQRAKENAVDQRWVKELENASAKFHITRLRELEIHLQNEIENLTAKRLKGTTETLGDIYKDSYYRSIFELQKGTGVGASFAVLDNRQIEKVLSKPWAPDGSNFSARIWKDRDKLVNELKTILTQDLIRGEPAEKVIADFAERMGVSRKAAERLIRTEAAFFAGQSRMDAYREMGIKKYKFVATLDMRTSEICRDMDGRVFELSEAKVGVNYPPLHVYCRSTTIPYFEDAAPGERAARDEPEGETYYVPGDMVYREWERKHGAGGKPKTGSEPEAKATEPPKPVEPPKVTTKSEQPPVPPKEPRPPEVRDKDRVFTTPEEADNWVDSVVPEWLLRLTPAEITAIRKYTGSAYEQLNKELRRQNPSKDSLEFAKLLKSALEKFVLTEAIVTWRGLKDNIYQYDDPKELIGVRLQDFGFFSTSLLRDRAFSGPVLIEVHIPAGIPAAPIQYWSDFPEEKEVLLSPIVNYVILDAKEKDGVLYLVIEVVSDETDETD